MAPRACDACRARKVRCDRVISAENNPCFHCRTSGTACQYEYTPRKRGPKSKRIRRIGASEQSNDFGPDGASPLASTSPLPQSLLTRTPEPPTVAVSILDGRIQAIHQDLVSSLAAIDSRWPLDATVQRCVDVYMDAVFGIRPLVSEARIRANLPLRPPQLNEDISRLADSSYLTARETAVGRLEEIRSYTLVTALCAATTYLLSTPADPNGALIGPKFLHASREMLHLYEDLDMECPDASSLVIRMFHAGAFHTVGRRCLSRHLFGAALRLSEQMQIQDPLCLQRIDPVESELRVMASRILQMSARYHRDLENQPLSVSDPSWSMPTNLDTSQRATLLMLRPSRHGFPAAYESQLLFAFDLFEKVWRAASGILTDLECLVRLDRHGRSGIVSRLLESSCQDHFLEPYSAFLSVLDHMPPYLYSPDSVELPDQTATAIQRRQFWIQRTNLIVSYHCLRMLILNRFANYGVVKFIGVQCTDSMIALRKTEIAHDMNAFLSSAPLDSLRVNGEACVNKIRYIGATLLEVIQQVQAPQIVDRANSLFSSLLSILANLDFRALNELANSDYSYLS